MKYLLLTLSLLISVACFGATTPWANYPTTNGFSMLDTLIMGNGSTNLTIQWGFVASTLPITNTVNTSSNSVYGNAVAQINTTSNSVVGTAQTIANTTSNLLNTQINTSSNLVFGNALAQINTTSNILNGQISGGGINAATATNISQSIANTSSNLVYGNALSQINTTSNLLNGQINTSSNLVYGNAVSQINTTSNLLNTLVNTSSNLNFANTVTAINTSSNSLVVTATNIVLQTAPVIVAGANITSTPAQNSRGGTNFTIAVTDPASLGQINVGTAWLTNTVIPTNALSGTIVDFNQGFAATNIAGNYTFTDVANVTAGSLNTAIRRFFASGADRTLAFPVSWHTNYGFIGVVTNGYQMDLLVSVTAARTNVTQIMYP